jgi:hypothetical protein
VKVLRLLDRSFRKAPKRAASGVLQDKCRDDPDINIVCEKVAFEGVTKFEDRRALHMVSFSKLAPMHHCLSVITWT